MDRLIVKNFGPLKDVDIELNKINLFIGENGSGKSVLGKLVTIVKNRTFSSQIEIIKEFNDYNINYIKDDTVIQLFFKNKELFSLNRREFFFSTLEQDTFSQGLEEGDVSSNNRFFLIIQNNNFLTPQYIPSERNLVSLFRESLSNLIVAEIPLPKFLLNFSSKFGIARSKIKELTFLDVKYVNFGQDRIYYNENNFLNLEHSSSGIQSALPLYLTVKYFANKHQSIIIEEPEQNLFPKAQTETIKYIIEQVSTENNLFLMTHSPYVLSTLNILIFAHKVAKMSEKTKEQVKEFVKEEQWINPDDFSAYYLKNGVARNIKSSRGLISDNEIDDISEDIAGEFDELMEIYREFKYAK